VADNGFQPGQSPSDRRAAFDLARRLRELEATMLARTPKLFEAGGFAVTTAGVAISTVCQITVPAQTVAGRVAIWWHGGYYVASTGGDTFEIFAVRPLASISPITSIRMTIIAGAAERHGSIDMRHAVLPANTAETYAIKAQRTSGTGTLGFFSDSRYNRITALWVPEP
jgi:hypothetical protein